MGRRRLDLGNCGDKIHLTQLWREDDKSFLERADVRPGEGMTLHLNDKELKKEEEERMWQRHLALVRVR